MSYIQDFAYEMAFQHLQSVRFLQLYWQHFEKDTANSIFEKVHFLHIKKLELYDPAEGTKYSKSSLSVSFVKKCKVNFQVTKVCNLRSKACLSEADTPQNGHLLYLLSSVGSGAHKLNRVDDKIQMCSELSCSRKCHVPRNRDTLPQIRQTLMNRVLGQAAGGEGGLVPPEHDVHHVTQS